MNRQTIETNSIATMSWLDEGIVDWAFTGQYYLLNGEQKQIGRYGFAFSFDRCLTSQDGRYAFIYKNLGTKGLLLKNGEIIREINRSYYQAEVYEYPAAFYTSEDGQTYLIHCPFEYNRLDFEEVESGKIITNIAGRKPSDIFHSRLEISPDNKFLLVKGWVWHPLDVVGLFDIKACIGNANLLDNNGLSPKDGPFETCAASFISDTEILVGSSDETDDNFPGNSIAVWNFKQQTLTSPVKILGEYGNVIAINNNYAWDFFDHPKIINIHTGEIVDTCKEIMTGKQKSSIIHHIDEAPQIVYSRQLQKVAIRNKNQIEILSHQ
jgi:hypothetical protein